MSNRRFLAMALAVLGIALAGVGLLAVSGESVEASPAAQGQGESACIAVRDKFANPGVILLGETVDVTLTVTALCAGEAFPLHIVLVLDASGSMSGEPNREMKKAARELIKRLDMRNNPSTKVGVVSFNTSANTLCQLTDSSSRANSCVNKVGAAGGTSIGNGFVIAFVPKRVQSGDTDFPVSVAERPPNRRRTRPVRSGLVRAIAAPTAPVSGKPRLPKIMTQFRAAFTRLAMTMANSANSGRRTDSM